MSSLLTADDIRRGLRSLDTAARAAGITVDLAVYGGAAMVIAYDARPATRDVDAVVRGPVAFVRTEVAKIAEIEGWPSDWLNDGVKGFLSGEEQMRSMREFQASPTGGLRVSVPTPEYMFAMKCMAMRSASEDSSGDIADIETMADLARIDDADTALAVVGSFYPASLIPPKVRFGVEEIMERRAKLRGS